MLNALAGNEHCYQCTMVITLPELNNVIKIKQMHQELLSILNKEFVLSRCSHIGGVAHGQMTIKIGSPAVQKLTGFSVFFFLLFPHFSKNKEYNSNFFSYILVVLP